MSMSTLEVSSKGVVTLNGVVIPWVSGVDVNIPQPLGERICVCIRAYVDSVMMDYTQPGAKE